MFTYVIFVLYLNLFDDLKHQSVTNIRNQEGANTFFTPLYVDIQKLSKALIFSF